MCVSSLQELEKIFKALDPIRDLMVSTLQPGVEWTPPQIIVLGNETSGKSTLLERIAMMPLFPVGEGMCTKVPIEVRLRRGPAQIPKLEVWDTSQALPSVLRKISVPAEGARRVVADAMGDCVREENLAATSGVTNDRRIILSLQREDLPNLNLLDLPGLVRKTI